MWNDPYYTRTFLILGGCPLFYSFLFFFLCVRCVWYSLYFRLIFFCSISILIIYILLSLSIVLSMTRARPSMLWYELVRASVCVWFTIIKRIIKRIIKLTIKRTIMEWSLIYLVSLSYLLGEKYKTGNNLIFFIQDYPPFNILMFGIFVCLAIQFYLNDWLVYRGE